MKRVTPVLPLLLMLCTSRLVAQNEPAFDPGSNLPTGFLDLTDIVMTTDADGMLTATARTRLGNAEALVLLSKRAAGEAGGITIGIKPMAWSITDAIPALSNPILDNLTFSNVALVISDQDIQASAGELPDAEFDFYREVYKSDDFTLVLKPGINLIAAIPAEGLAPNSPLITIMDALGIEKGTILLQGTLGKSLTVLTGGGGGAGAIKDLYLRAELPPMHPAGSPAWFRSGQLALELTGDPSVRLVGEINVLMDEEELKFFLATAVARTGLSLSGGLIAENGWQQPFGIPWLVLDKVVLALGISPTGITPGFAAKMIIGKKDMDVAIALTLTPAGVPSGFMFKGESQAGVAMSDIAELQARMAAARDGALKAAANDVETADLISLDALPPIAIKDMGLQFAPKPIPDLGVERGFKIKGRLWLPLSADGELTDFAGVDVGITEDGFWARGDLGAFTLGPLVWQDAKLDLTATREAQYMIMKGEVELFGARQLVDMSMSKSGFSFHTETRLYDMFSADITAQSVFNLRQPDFQVHAVASADFGNAVGPMVQQAMVNFTKGSANVVAAATTAADAAAQALAKSQAAADELKRVLETQRQTAADNLADAQQEATTRRAALSSALTARNRAWQSYEATPVLPATTKAERLAAYTRSNAVYLQRGAQYSAAAAAAGIRQRIYNAIPPVDQNVLMKSAETAVAELRAQLQLAQQQLAEVESGITSIQDALARGEQLLVVEKAEFRGGLQSAIRGEAVRWDITGSFAGQPFQLQQTMDARNIGDSAAQIVQALLRQ